MTKDEFLSGAKFRMSDRAGDADPVYQYCRVCDLKYIHNHTTDRPGASGYHCKVIYVYTNFVIVEITVLSKKLKAQIPFSEMIKL